MLRRIDYWMKSCSASVLTDSGRPSLLATRTPMILLTMRHMVSRPLPALTGPRPSRIGTSIALPTLHQMLRGRPSYQLNPRPLQSSRTRRPTHYSYSRHFRQMHSERIASVTCRGNTRMMAELWMNLRMSHRLHYTDNRRLLNRQLHPQPSLWRLTTSPVRRHQYKILSGKALHPPKRMACRSGNWMYQRMRRRQGLLIASWIS